MTAPLKFRWHSEVAVFKPGTSRLSFNGLMVRSCGQHSEGCGLDSGPELRASLAVDAQHMQLEL